MLKYPKVQHALLALSMLCMTAHADTLIIGQSTPLTGQAAEIGKGLSAGLEAAIAEVNDKGGVNGHKLKIELMDNQSEPRRSVFNTATLVRSKNALILAGYYGKPPLAEQVLLNEGKIPLVGASGATEDKETRSRYVFFTRTGFPHEVETLINLLVGKLGMKRIGILSSSDPTLSAAREAAVAELAKRKLKPEAIGNYDKDTESVDAAVKTLVEASPEAVLMLATTKPAAMFAKKFRDAGINAQLYSTSSVNYEEVVKLIGAEKARGIGIAQVYPYPLDNGEKIVREYQDAIKKFGPKDAKFGYASIEGYLVGRTVIEAIRRAGKTPTRENVHQALETMNNVDFGGFAITYNDKSHAGAKLVDITMIGSSGNLRR